MHPTAGCRLHCVCCPEAPDTMLADMREISGRPICSPPPRVARSTSQADHRCAWRTTGAVSSGVLYHTLHGDRCTASARGGWPASTVSFGDRVKPYGIGDLLI